MPGPATTPWCSCAKWFRERWSRRIITGEYYPKAKKFNAPAEHRIIGVLDLNGDGIMEIVLSGRYYEGDWVDAYRVDGAKIIKLFSMGCGA